MKKITTPDQKDEVDAYVQQALRQTDIQREASDKDKTGVFTGGYAINPVNNERIPIWIADYVLVTYGTGAIMAVPAHDQRDFEFARKFDIEIRVVIQPEDEPLIIADEMTEAVPAYGAMVNSGSLTGTPADEAFDKIIDYLEDKGIGRREVNYRLRDWLISQAAVLGSANSNDSLREMWNRSCSRRSITGFAAGRC